MWGDYVTDLPQLGRHVGKVSEVARHAEYGSVGSVLDTIRGSFSSPLTQPYGHGSTSQDSPNFQGENKDGGRPLKGRVALVSVDVEVAGDSSSLGEKDGDIRDHDLLAVGDAELEDGALEGDNVPREGGPAFIVLAPIPL